MCPLNSLRQGRVEAGKQWKRPVGFGEYDQLSFELLPEPDQIRTDFESKIAALRKEDNIGIFRVRSDVISFGRWKVSQLLKSRILRFYER